MMPDINTLTSLALTGPVFTGIKDILNKNTKGRSNFENTGESSSSTLMYVLLVLALVIIYMTILPIAVYKLTNNLFHAVMCVLFSGIYLPIILIYYAFSGYKIN